eukprot:gene24844-24947_t
MNDLVAIFHKINRFLAAVNTSYSLPFIFTNFLRDLQQSMIVLQEEKVKGLSWKVLRSLPSAFAGVNRMLQNNLDTDWARYAREFADAGGKIGFMDRGDIDREKRGLEKLMRDAKAGPSRKTWLAVRKHGFERLARYNDSVENTLRLAAYVELRKAGATKEKAAFAARELTVNFNRKGEWSPGLNAFFMFFSASTEGAASLFMRLGRSPILRKVAAAVMIEALLQDMLNRMLAGDDDDGKN